MANWQTAHTTCYFYTSTKYIAKAIKRTKLMFIIRMYIIVLLYDSISVVCTQYNFIILCMFDKCKVSVHTLCLHAVQPYYMVKVCRMSVSSEIHSLIISICLYCLFVFVKNYFNGLEYFY